MSAMVMTVSMVFGGLALFMYGMGAMTDGLRSFAESRLRSILSKATRHRWQGLALGTTLGVLIHSSAATVMIVGFANAGLVNLVQAVPVIVGSNIGTSLSMQLVSFKLTDFAFAGVALGLLVKMVAGGSRYRHLGTTLLGFGLLFLGMKVMSEAIGPHRETLAPMLEMVDGTSVTGILIGLVGATLLTAVIQSSGATIGMCFALISAGVFVEVRQVYPIVMGAHIGTCATAMLGSIGTNVVARRCAAAHLFFNVFTVLLALLMQPLVLSVVEWSSTDVLRQTANLHVVVMLLGAVVVTPLAQWLAWAVERVVGRGEKLPEPSYLEPDLVMLPEQALAASLKELKRVAGVCQRSWELNREVFFSGDRKLVREIRLNEAVVNGVKVELVRFLRGLTTRYLSRRQLLLVDDLLQCTNHLERIGDHLDALCELSLRRRAAAKGGFDQAALEQIFSLGDEVGAILVLLRESLGVDREATRLEVTAINEARARFERRYKVAESFFSQQVADHALHPEAGLLFSEYLAVFRRMVRHVQAIAGYQRSPEFWIKKSKLEQPAREMESGLTVLVEDVEAFREERERLRGEEEAADGEGLPPGMTDT